MVLRKAGISASVVWAVTPL